ncbi:Scr1 family TA system antitoxin-like transcriptional regulator [Streptosporangium amethystogenes subsp. fukuiense]|uniref:Scr1 family TA system antitoxin-like transcriptional regulator n=1 Tax=Streptosporangium amethystogenes subsp. fukuiense TaxID=698418 RepID=A0ABW2T178_9ACTN
MHRHQVGNRNARRKGWWDACGDTLPTELASYIAPEAEAASIRGFSAQIIPGMLQTDEYARSIAFDHLRATAYEVEESFSFIGRGRRSPGCVVARRGCGRALPIWSGRE